MRYEVVLMWNIMFDVSRPYLLAHLYSFCHKSKAGSHNCDPAALKITDLTYEGLILACIITGDRSVTAIRVAFLSTLLSIFWTALNLL